jgi:hypothetical protein
MSSWKIYIKNRHSVVVSPKFVYCFTTYKMWRYGASLMDETYYTSNKPLNISKIPKLLKKKDYVIQRFINLEGAPEEYLINEGYKCE